MLVQCTRPYGPRALDASKFSTRALDLSYFTRKINANLLTFKQYNVMTPASDEIKFGGFLVRVNNSKACSLLSYRRRAQIFQILSLIHLLVFF